MHAKRNQKRYHQLIFSEVFIESIRSHKLDSDIPYLTTGTSDTTNTNKNLIHNVTRANAWQNTYSWILIQSGTITKTSKTVPFLFLKNWRKKRLLHVKEPKRAWDVIMTSPVKFAFKRLRKHLGKQFSALNFYWRYKPKESNKWKGNEHIEFKIT